MTRFKTPKEMTTMYYIPRAMESEILYASKHYPVIMVCGLRQSGKSTMLNHLADADRTYVSLSDIDALLSALEDPKGFFETYVPPVLIDEFQLAPALLTTIKYIVDEKKRNGENSYGLFWLTGSQKFSMMKNVSESLAGRCAVFDMSSLTSAELDKRDTGVFIPNLDSLRKRFESSVAKSTDEIYERIFKGGMPELYSNELEAGKYFSDYVRTYLMRDVMELSAVSDTTSFLKFLKYMAITTGQELNYNSISKSLGLNYAATKKWVMTLDALGVIKIVEPYYNNKLKSLTKTEKFYFMDTGIVSYLCGIKNAKELKNDPKSGAIFETYVVSEIVKSFYNAKTDCDVYYYRDTEKREIDLIIEDGEKLYPIEIKTNFSPSNATKNMYVLDASGKDIQPAIVICFNNKFIPCGRSAWYFPVFAL
ncbi:MAG: DUF4143 domain-containing protein [Clostridia bacterium]|nr:DUF4143 domain-containing protein [Clostridia bacterium]